MSLSFWLYSPKGDEFKGKYFVKPIRKRIHEELRELKERKKSCESKCQKKMLTLDFTTLAQNTGCPNSHELVNCADKQFYEASLSALCIVK